jgi:PAS domain S-box-containing protein
MTRPGDFYLQYTDALGSYLSAQDEASLAVGHELGRRALREEISMLDIIEHHFELVDDLAKNSRAARADALQFLLQTLTALDVATRGFLEGTQRYQKERARAEALAHRNQFRTALVNSLQEGFFVIDDKRAVIEINEAFAKITGYPANEVPYPPPYPWVIAEKATNERLSGLFQTGSVQYEVPIRHRDGHIVWVALNANAVTPQGTDDAVYVGTIRDITAERAFAARESAVLRLATAVGVAKSVAELLSITLDVCRAAIDVQRVLAVRWPPDGGEPAVHMAGEPSAAHWDDLDPVLRATLHDARRQLPLTVQPVESADCAGQSRGIVAVLSGSGDVALWLELRVPRLVSAEDRLLVTMLAAHLSLAVQHVRQFEFARDTSLTLQRAMLAPSEPPAGFAVRYEPAVSPLEIGGDWYDVLEISDRRIAIIVGDCVGRGLSAAAVMGQLRSSARALLLTGAEPAKVLEQLDVVAAWIPDAVCTTAFVAILDTETTTVRYSCAGHLPAVLVSPESAVTMLADARSVPLAVHRDDSRPQAAQVLMPGSTLVFYTDGLVERRSKSIDAGIARVGEIVTGAMTLTVDAVADGVVGAMAPSGGYDDDVALVVYRCPPAPLLIETDAAADRLRDIRHRLSAWLGTANIPAAASADIVMAVNEACENSVEHAYRGHSGGQVRVMADISDCRIRVRVADSGSWKAPSRHPDNRGRGLALVRSVAEQFELDHSGSGTTVTMRFRTPAGMTNGQSPAHP